MTTHRTSDKKLSYLPVAWEYREIIEEQIVQKNRGKIFFFNDENKIDEIEGTVVAMIEQKDRGVYIQTDKNEHVRIDRIITLFGKIGAAYDEYDAFGSSCMDCNGGYSKEELNNM